MRQPLLRVRTQHDAGNITYIWDRTRKISEDKQNSEYSIFLSLRGLKGENMDDVQQFINDHRDDYIDFDKSFPGYPRPISDALSTALDNYINKYITSPNAIAKVNSQLRINQAINDFQVHFRAIFSQEVVDGVNSLTTKDGYVAQPSAENSGAGINIGIGDNVNPNYVARKFIASKIGSQPEEDRNARSAVTRAIKDYIDLSIVNHAKDYTDLHALITKYNIAKQSYDRYSSQPHNTANPTELAKIQDQIDEHLCDLQVNWSESYKQGARTIYGNAYSGSPDTHKMKALISTTNPETNALSDYFNALDDIYNALKTGAVGQRAIDRKNNIVQSVIGSFADSIRFTQNNNKDSWHVYVLQTQPGTQQPKVVARTYLGTKDHGDAITDRSMLSLTIKRSLQNEDFADLDIQEATSMNEVMFNCIKISLHRALNRFINEYNDHALSQEVHQNAVNNNYLHNHESDHPKNPKFYKANFLGEEKISLFKHLSPNASHDPESTLAVHFGFVTQKSPGVHIFLPVFSRAGMVPMGHIARYEKTQYSINNINLDENHKNIERYIQEFESSQALLPSDEEANQLLTATFAQNPGANLNLFVSLVLNSGPRFSQTMQRNFNNPEENEIEQKHKDLFIQTCDQLATQFKITKINFANFTLEHIHNIYKYIHRSATGNVNQSVMTKIKEFTNLAYVPEEIKTYMITEDYNFDAMKAINDRSLNEAYIDIYEGNNQKEPGELLLQNISNNHFGQLVAYVSSKQTNIGDTNLPNFIQTNASVGSHLGFVGTEGATNITAACVADMFGPAMPDVLPELEAPFVG